MSPTRTERQEAGARRWERAVWWRLSRIVLLRLGVPGGTLLAAMRDVEATNDTASLSGIARVGGRRLGAVKALWHSLGLPPPPRGAAPRVSDLPRRPPDPETRALVRAQRGRQREAIRGGRPRASMQEAARAERDARIIAAGKADPLRSSRAIGKEVGCSRDVVIEVLGRAGLSRPVLPWLRKEGA